VSYESAEETSVDGEKAYQLNGVYAFDRTDDVIYVAHSDYVYQITFPVAEDNPNLSDPVANNKIVNEMLETFTFTD